MTENLKRCPFCGGEASLVDGSDSGVFAGCSNCCSCTEFFKTKNEALKAWNSRPIEDELHGKIEKLEAENTRLREALTEIKNTVESKQDTVYPFHIALDSKDGLFILETVDNT